MTRVALCSEAKNEPFIFSIQAKFLDKKLLYMSMNGKTCS